MSATSDNSLNLLEEKFAIEQLNLIFSKLKRSSAKGIDRIDIEKFESFKQKKIKNSNENLYQEQIKVIHNKCRSGEYKFAPYLEKLQSKGRGKEPRVIGIPTVRDRIALYALKEILSTKFDDCVRRKLADTYIYEIKKILEKQQDYSKLAVFRTDIQNFYGSIDRAVLQKKLQSKLRCEQTLKLLKQAIENPIVPKNYKRDNKKHYKTKKGIPQGISISNLLADIYLQDLDKDMKKHCENNIGNYFRYVDDIIIISDRQHIYKLTKQLKHNLRKIELKLSPNKTRLWTNKIKEIKFDYLGYRFELLEIPSRLNITVRSSTVEKFIESIAGKFANYRYYKKLKTKHYQDLDLDLFKKRFILQLNERITGAIADNKRYGWLFYFSAINDKSLLYKMDKIIASFFTRLEDFNGQPPKELKKLSKTYHKIIYKDRLEDGYIHDYRKYKNIEDKGIFLIERGKEDPNEIKKYSDLKVNEEFEKLKNQNLSQLEKDNANMY